MSQFSLTEKENHTEILIGGELTIYCAEPVFSEHIKPFTPSSDVIVNLEKIEEFDTAGAQLLLVLKQQCSAQGFTFSLGERSSCVETYLNLFNLKDQFSLNS